MFYKNTLMAFIFFIPIGLFAQISEDALNYPYEIGKKYNILQYRANIRKEPTRNSNVIAILNLNDEIEILENSGTQEKINDVWAYWYKIKYGNIVGYTFGGNIAAKTLVTDIDNNGINDYFYYRNSYEKTPLLCLDTRTDVIIYINQKRISTNNLRIENPYIGWKYEFDWCKFIEYDNYVVIELYIHHRHYIWVDIFKINQNGVIEFIEGKESK